MAIRFTQYLMPNGRQKPVEIDRPEKIETLARKIVANGCRFEIEVLMNGYVSMEILKDVPDPDIDDSIDIQIVPNGPEVPKAVDKMVRNAAKILNL